MKKQESCKCKSRCQNRRCLCLKNNEPCDENCVCADCSNPLNGVDVDNLSVCAIQIRFDTGTEQTIRSVLGHVDDSQLPNLGVRFNIKLHEKEEEIRVNCKPVYIHQLDQDMYAMGMIFMELEKKYQALINNFVEFSLEPL